MPDASETSLGSETLKSTVARFVMAAAGFVGAIVFARWLGPDAYGGYYMLYAVAVVAVRPVAGWANGVKKRLSESTSNAPALVGGYLAFAIAWFLLIAVTLSILGGALAARTGVALAAPIVFAIVVAEGAFEGFDNLVESRGRIAVVTWTDTLRSYLTLPAQFVLVFLGLGAAGMAFGLAGASLVCIPVLWYYLDVSPSRPTKRSLRSVWRFARYSIPTSFVATTYARFDVLLLGFLVGSGAAGHYEAVAKLTIPALFVAETASRAMMAKTSSLHSRGGDPAADVTHTLAFVSIIAIPLVFGGAALASLLVTTVYGPAYRSASLLLVGLTLVRAVESQNRALDAAIQGVDRPDMVMRISVLSLVLNVALGVPLVYYVGPVGVVVATLVAELARYFVYARAVRRELPNVTVLPPLLVKQVAAGAVMFGVVEVVQSILPVSGWVTLVVLLGVGALSYGGVLWVISDQLRETAWSVLSVH